MHNVAYIPVRGGSASIPLKNIKPLLGKPLVYWAASAAAASNFVKTVYIATDSEQIRAVVEALNLPKVQVIGRSPGTATNTASSESALLEFAEHYYFDNVAFIQATSPLLTTSDVDRGFGLLLQDGCDSVLSAVKDKHFYWKDGASNSAVPLNYDVFARPRRQDFEGCWQENGAVYLTSRDALLSSRNRVSGAIHILPMSERTLFEIDEPSDWPIIEALLVQQVKEAESQDLAVGLEERALPKAIDASQIKLFLTDCDGCLTDGGMYYSVEGEAFKKFNTRDGMALSLLAKTGIKRGIITGENSQAVKKRAEKLKLDYCELACDDKLAAARRICSEEGISLGEVAYVGDDLNDLECMQAVKAEGGLTACPADSVPDVLACAGFVAKHIGGNGAVREIVDWMLNKC